MNRHFPSLITLPLLLLPLSLLLSLSACGGAGVEEPPPTDAPPSVQDERGEADTQGAPDAQPEEDVPGEAGTPSEQPAPDTGEQTVQETQTIPDAQAVQEPPSLPEVNAVGDSVSIRELAYDRRKGGDCVVYLPENQRYVPFLVLTGDYGGNTLLLRREVLPDARAFNSYSAFYADSATDRYLSEEYPAQLAAVRDLIRPSEITITQEDALGVSGTATKTVTRDIFLLSCAETGFTALVNAGTEGTALDWFSTPENRIARQETGSASGWWLRTPDTYYLSAAYGIGPDGSLGSGNAYNENGIRPAFCISPDARAFPTNDVADGQTVYVLSTGP